MFWRKRKTNLNDENVGILTLATKLGLERRKNVRVRYPENTHVCKLPEISFQGRELKIQNISAGGCCLIDTHEALGSGVGHDIELKVHWATGNETIQSRIVSRGHLIRHIQFLNMNSNRENQLRKFMSMGVRGLSMRQNEKGEINGPDLSVAEIWSSFTGDSVALEHDPRRLAQVHLAGIDFTIQRAAWPVKNLQGCSKLEFEQIILFLVNVPAPSELLLELIAALEAIFIEVVS